PFWNDGRARANPEFSMTGKRASSSSRENPPGVTMASIRWRLYNRSGPRRALDRSPPLGTRDHRPFRTHTARDGLRAGGAVDGSPRAKKANATFGQVSYAERWINSQARHQAAIHNVDHGVGATVDVPGCRGGLECVDGHESL